MHCPQQMLLLFVLCGCCLSCRLPGDRWSADHYLTSWPRQLFPHHFSDVLHPFFGSLLGLDPDARLAAVAARYSQLAAAVQGTSPGSELSSGSPALLPSAVKVCTRCSTSHA